MPTVNVDSTNFEEQVLKSKGLIIVDFWAPWCPWCRKLAPDYETLSNEYGDRVKFAKLNADDSPSIAEQYGVQGLPTLKFFCGGRTVGELTGYRPKPMLKAEIENMVAHYKECLEQSSPVR